MKTQEVIHVKLENHEATESKKNILKTQADLLEIAKSLRKYKKLRLEEINIKLKISTKLRTFKQKSTQLQQILPKIKIPKILKKEDLEELKEEEIQKKDTFIEEKYDDALGRELREIQERLRALN
jgi:hypothetical protein